MITKETKGRPVNKLEHSDENGSLEEESKSMESFLAEKSTKATHHIHTLKWGMTAADLSQQQLTVPEVLDLDNMDVILVIRQLRSIDSEDNHCWLREACQLYQYT